MERGYATYKQVSLETASGPQLLLALYDGAIRFLARADQAIEAGEVETVNTYIGRTQDILGELMTTLDMSQGEIPARLMDLYIYMHRTLVDANVQKESRKLHEVQGLLRDLRTAWRGAVDQVQTSGELGADPRPAVGNG